MAINVSDNNPRVNYTATSGQTVFTVSFEFFEETDLTVYINGTEKTLTTDYTVAGGDGSTGTITLVTGATASDKVAIVRDVAMQRTTDFNAGQDINRAALNEQLDTLTALVADIDDRASRALQLNDHEVAVGITLPATDDRKGKVLGFNEITGDVQSGPTLADVQSLADVSADIATLADIEDGTDATDAIQTAAGVASDISTVSGISANVTTVAGISSDVTAVAADATDIGTVATNISSVNTVATNIADVITVANDLNEAVSEVVTVADDLNEAVSEIDTVAGSISNVDTVGTNIADVNTVAGISANVTTVAGISSDTSTVAGISGNVTTVAGISSDVTAVAADATDIGTVATSISNVNAVAGNATNINAVAGNATNINAVAADAADIGTVSGISANVTTVAGLSSSVSTLALISSDITTVAGISANVTTVAGDTANIATIATNLNGTDTIGTVAGSISNVNAVGGAISDVSTVASNLADVQSFANTYRIGATDPTTSLDTGDLFYNTTSSTLKVYTGSGWEQGVTAGSGFLPLTGGTLTGGLTLSADPSTNLQAATKQYVDNEVAGIVDSAPATLDTLNELAAALGDDANFSTTVTNNIATKVSKSGDTMTGNLSFGDNDKAIFGAGSDLQIYHDGSNSFIEEAGTGNLIVAGSTEVKVRGTPFGSNFAVFKSGAVDLYASGTKRLATTSTGVDITGSVVNSGHLLHNNTSGLKIIGGGNATNDGSNLTLYGSTNASAGTFRFRNGTATYLNISGNGDISFYEDTGTTPKFFWDASAESLGIGTSSPERLLHVYEGNSGITPNTSGHFTLESDGANFINILKPNGTVSGLLFSGNSVNADGRITYDDSGASRAMQFYTASTERMRIDSSGNVGIGTNSPSNFSGYTTLDVVNATNGGAILARGSTVEARFVADDPTGTVQVKAQSNHPLMFATSGTERMRIDSIGKVGIGTSSPSGSLAAGGLHVTDRIAVGAGSTGTPALHYDADTDTGIFFGTGVVAVSTGGSERMRITSSGSVGIGTSSPSSNLHVEGGAGANIAIKSTAGSHWRIGDGVGSTNGTFSIYNYTNSSSGLTIDSSGTVSASSFNSTSDATLKTNVETLTGSLDAVKAMRGVSFDWIDNGNSEVGVIAQEIEAIVPDVVSTNDQGIKSVKYGNLVGVLIEAIKEQQAQIDELKARLGD